MKKLSSHIFVFKTIEAAEEFDENDIEYDRDFEMN